MSDHKSIQNENMYQLSKGNRDVSGSIVKIKQNLNKLGFKYISQIKQVLARQDWNSVDDQHKISAKITQLVKRFHTIGAGSDSIHNIKILNRIIYQLMKLSAFVRLAVRKILCKKLIQQAVFSSQQQTKFSARLKTLDHQIEKKLTASRDALAAKASLMNGLGLFRNFINECFAVIQVNLLKQFRQAIKQIRHRVMKTSTSTMARRLINQKLTTVNIRVCSDIVNADVSQGNDPFKEVHRIQQQGFHYLRLIRKGYGQVLKNTVAFGKFVDQIKNVIVKSSHLPKSVKLDLANNLNYYRHTVLDRFKRPYEAVADYVLDAERPLLLRKLLTLTIRFDYQLINEQILGSNSREGLSNFIKTSQIVKYRFLNGKFGPIDLNSFSKALDRLNRAFQASRAFIYRQQVERTVNSVCLRILDYTDLPLKKLKLLRQRVRIYGHYLELHPFKVRPVFIKQRLMAFFDRQYESFLHQDILNQCALVRDQIKNSRLDDDFQHSFLERVMKIKKSSASNAIKMLKLKGVVDRSLVQDRQLNLIKLLKLNHSARKHDSSIIPALIGSSRLEAVLSHVSSADSILQVDHDEQLGENYLYREIIFRQKGFSQDRRHLVLVQTHKFHNQINLAILSTDINRLLNDTLDRFSNEYGARMLQKQGIAQSATRWSNQFAHEIKQRLSWLFPRIKAMYTGQIHRLAWDAHYQLMAYTSVKSVFSQLRNLQSKALVRINHAKGLLQLETVQQFGIRKLNHFVNRIVGQMDYKRFQFNQRIDLHLRKARKHLNQGSFVSAFINRIVKVANQADYYANYNIDDSYNKIVHDYQNQLSQLVKHSYQYQWIQHFNIVNSLIKQNIRNVSATSLQACLNLLANVNSKVIMKLNQSPCDGLKSVLNTGYNQLHKVVKRSIYLNPTKRSISQKLDKDVRRSSYYIDKFLKSKAQTKYLKRLYQARKNTAACLIRNNDKRHLLSTYDTNHRKMASLNHEIVRKAELNRYVKDSSRVEKHLQGFKFLDDKKSRSVDDRFNRAYHKAIHEILHASRIKDYVNHERSSENSLKQVVDYGKRLNDSRIKYFNPIKSEINLVKQQIDKLHNLQAADKHDSDHLLDEIQQRSAQIIKKAADKKHLLLAEKNGKKMALQVLKKVNSASVLVDAIRSANNQISLSSLNKNEKQQMLKRIQKTIMTDFNSSSDK